MNPTQIDFTFPVTDEPIVQLGRTVGIDTNFPEEEANTLAHIESFNKHLFRPNTYLHKWWARRSGTTFRYIMKQLVPNATRRDYYSPGGLEGVTVLDPMMGGGTIAHEAIRLGANVIGFDIDPIPVLQAKASLSNLPPWEKTEVFRSFTGELSKRVSRYYSTTCPECGNAAEIQFTLYGQRKLGPDGEVLVVDSLVLREEPDDTEKSLKSLYPSLEFSLNGRSWPVLAKDEAQKQGINGRSSDILSAPFAERYVPLVIMGYCEAHKSFLKGMSPSDNESISKASRWTKRNAHYASPDFEIPDGPKSGDLLNRGIRYFSELFFPRQLAYITHSADILGSMPEKHALWLSLLLSTSLEFNSALCGYKGAAKRRPGAIRHVFAHHAYSFPYTALENNPVFSRSTSGTLRSLFESRIEAAGEWAREPVERRLVNGSWKKQVVPEEVDIGVEATSVDEFPGKKRMFFVTQNDSSRLPLPAESVDFVVTDPPYFDNVQYSDLSHFFRCWLRTFLPDKADWQYVARGSAVAETSADESKFATVIGKIWKECDRVLKRPHGRLIFTYHHWRPEAWTKLTVALKQAGFSLVNAFVVHSENPISVHIMNVKSLKHDTILVLKPDDGHRSRTWNKPEPTVGSDSYSFCKACGHMTGWILENDLTESEIEKEWSNFMKG